MCLQGAASLQKQLSFFAPSLNGSKAGQLFLQARG